MCLIATCRSRLMQQAVGQVSVPDVLPSSSSLPTVSFIIPDLYTLIMPYRFDGSVCLITGAASGIGQATARKMASLGAKLALSDINGEGLKQTVQSCGEGHEIETFDVADSGACNRFVEAIIQKLGPLDHVFNCAGVNPTAYPLTDTTDAYFDKLVGTNLKGTYNITRAVIPHLARGASMVNVSSIMGVSVAPEYAIYVSAMDSMPLYRCTTVVCHISWQSYPCRPEHQLTAIPVP